MPTTLYVIGNGFDLHHGMATAYRDFGKFLRCHHRELRNLLDEYFPIYDAEDFWGNFEQRLSAFDADMLIENSEHWIVPYSADDWKDAYHHDYAFELDRVVKALSEELLAAFTDWIRQISIPSRTNLVVPPANIDLTGYFINFNYTDTLQQLYGVSDTRIWHVHGAARSSKPLILGHGWRPGAAEKQIGQLDLEQADTRIIEGAQIIDEYFERTFKPTDRIIAENSEKFAALGDVGAIHVLGHSLSDVDLPYLQKIADSTRPSAGWRISFIGASTDLEGQFEKIASPSLATFWPLTEV